MDIWFPLPSPLRSLATFYRNLQTRALAWTALLTVTVAVASVSPEVAFLWTASPYSSFSKPCREADTLRVPANGPGDVVCLPAQLFQRSRLDMVVPPVFAALVVAGSACFVRAICAREGEEAT